MPSDGNGRTHEPNLRELVAQIDGLVRLYDERDRRYEERFAAQGTAVNAALAALDKQTTSAFAASKDAIVKAEQAQSAYNLSHNDLARKMDAQYKDMLPRAEAESRINAVIEKVEDVRKAVYDLRESRSQIGGRDAQREQTGASARWLIGITVATLVNLVMGALNLLSLLRLAGAQ